MALSISGDFLFGGFHKWGYPKIDGLYMFIWENPTEMDDDWRYPHDYGNHHFFLRNMRNTTDSAVTKYSLATRGC